MVKGNLKMYALDSFIIIVVPPKITEIVLILSIFFQIICIYNYIKQLILSDPILTWEVFDVVDLKTSMLEDEYDNDSFWDKMNGNKRAYNIANIQDKS